MRKCLDKTSKSDLTKTAFTTVVDNVTLSLKFEPNYYTFSAQFTETGLGKSFTNLHKAKKFFTFFKTLLTTKKYTISKVKKYMKENNL
jgi:hypothetical protein